MWQPDGSFSLSNSTIWPYVAYWLHKGQNQHLGVDWAGCLLGPNMTPQCDNSILAAP